MAAGKITSNNFLNFENVDRIVEKLTKMRGAALKVGQMLSIQDSELIPKEIQQIMKRVQNNANYMLDRQLDVIIAD